MTIFLRSIDEVLMRGDIAPVLFDHPVGRWQRVVRPAIRSVARTLAIGPKPVKVPESACAGAAPFFYQFSGDDPNG
jgi:hypothetical protein